MKTFIFGFLLLTFVACENYQENKVKEDTTTKKEVKTEFPIVGVWTLTSYFDSIEKYKEVARFRLNRAVWFSLVADVKKDSIFIYGSITDVVVPRYKKDTIAKFDNWGGEWIIVREKDNLTLSQMPNENSVLKSHTMRKREDLEFLVEDFDPRFRIQKITQNVTAYLNERLFAGSYIILGTENQITFKNNGQIIGFDDYTSYAIRNYFGTIHPFLQKDIVTLSQDRKTDYWSWKFVEDTLILNKLKMDIYTDNWKTTNEVKKLINIKDY